MQPNVRGIGIQVSEDLYNYIKEKLKKLNKYLQKVLYIDIIIKLERKRFFTEMNTSVDGFIIHAQAESNELYTSIEKVIDKVIKQVKRYKEKIKSHKIPSFKYPGSSIPKNLKENKSTQFLIRRDIAKPMNVEEAIIELNSIKRNFFFFLNKNTHCINAVYKNNEGNIVLVEPEV